MKLTDLFQKQNKRVKTYIVWAMASFSFALIVAGWLAYTLPAHNEQWSVSSQDLASDNWSALRGIEKQFQDTRKDLVPAINNLAEAIKTIGNASNSNFAASSTI